MILHWLKLIRPFNLFILACTQYALNIFLFIPNFNEYGILFSLNAFQFFLLVLSTVLICAGGYIINDCLDIDSDEINKPQKQYVGKNIPKESALKVYWFFTLLGLGLGIYVSYLAGNIKLATVHGVTILLLYFYSASYKKIPLLGNIVVAFLTAVSILIVGIFEPHIYYLERFGDYYIAGIIWKYLLGISVFAFLLTLVREIIKDVEDMEGDMHVYAHTIVIAWGIQAAKGIIAAVLTFLVFAVLYLIFLGPLSDEFLYKNYGIILSVALIYLFILTMRAKEKKDFSFLSKLTKMIMLIGLCFLPLYYFVNF